MTVPCPCPSLSLTASPHHPAVQDRIEERIEQFLAGMNDGHTIFYFWSVFSLGGLLSSGSCSQPMG